ncbi:MAG: PilZ domain-containing protein [Candidatus Omnitrophota bacterium]
MVYAGPERRRFPRVKGRFIVSYRILKDVDNADISQTKNLSLGGMLLTTNRLLDPGTKLALEIRLPFDPNPIILSGEVLESREVTKNLIYDTRIKFTSIDDKHKKIIGGTIEYYLKKG